MLLTTYIANLPWLDAASIWVKPKRISYVQRTETLTREMPLFMQHLCSYIIEQINSVPKVVIT